MNTRINKTIIQLTFAALNGIDKHNFYPLHFNYTLHQNNAILINRILTKTYIHSLKFYCNSSLSIISLFPPYAIFAGMIKCLLVLYLEYSFNMATIIPSLFPKHFLYLSHEPIANLLIRISPSLNFFQPPVPPFATSSSTGRV